MGGMGVCVRVGSNAISSSVSISVGSSGSGAANTDVRRQVVSKNCFMAEFLKIERSIVEVPRNYSKKELLLKKNRGQQNAALLEHVIEEKKGCEWRSAKS